MTLSTPSGSATIPQAGSDPQHDIDPAARGLTVGELVTNSAGILDLAWIGGRSGAERQAAVPAADTVDQVGYLNLFHPHRLQVVGEAEIAYFRRVSTHRREQILEELAAGAPPALVMALDCVPPELVQACDTHAIALLSCSQNSTRAIELLRTMVSKALAPNCLLHGVLMDVLGIGVLISGASGLGKSELALELISRGHGLVADDAVEVHRVGPSTIEGRCPALLQGMLEVRGLGLLDIKTIFGETAVRRKMRLKLIVQLLRRSTHDDEYERLPLEDLTENVLGLDIRKVVIPVAAGRNLAVLTEAAVRNTILQLRGIDSKLEFMARQRLAIDNGQE
jgi:HPr kinase/phosphorylase